MTVLMGEDDKSAGSMSERPIFTDADLGRTLPLNKPRRAIATCCLDRLRELNPTVVKRSPSSHSQQWQHVERRVMLICEANGATIGEHGDKYEYDQSA